MEPAGVLANEVASLSSLLRDLPGGTMPSTRVRGRYPPPPLPYSKRVHARMMRNSSRASCWVFGETVSSTREPLLEYQERKLLVDGSHEVI